MCYVHLYHNIDTTKIKLLNRLKLDTNAFNQLVYYLKIICISYFCLLNLLFYFILVYENVRLIKNIIYM